MITLDNSDKEVYGRIKKVKTQINKQKDRMRFLSYTDEERDKIIKSAYIVLLKKALKEKRDLFGPMIDIEISDNLLKKLKEEEKEIFNLIIRI